MKLSFLSPSNNCEIERYDTVHQIKSNYLQLFKAVVYKRGTRTQAAIEMPCRPPPPIKH